MPRRQRDKEEEEEDDEGEPYELEDIDEDAEEEEPEEEVPARKGKKQKTSKSKKRKSTVVDEDAEEDDDEEEDRRPAAKAARFFDEEADVDDEEDDEEDDDEELGDLIADDDVVGEEPNYREIDRHHARTQDRFGFEEEDDEKLETMIKNRYSNQAYAVDEFDSETSAVTQQGLLPTKHDPKLWLVHCRPGLERTACMQLLQKSYNMQGEGSALLIKSAICLEHLKGYVYVEAEKESHVLDAIKGLRTMFSGKGATLVPLGEMVDAITPNRKAKVPLGVDSWVRVKAGLYKDDLAQVVEADMGSGRATIRIVPRLDYDQLASGERIPFGQKREGIRPPAKPFSFEEAGRLGLNPELRKDNYSGESFVYIKSQKFKDGYQYKGISVKNLIVMDTAPQVDELQRFKMAEKAARDTSSLNEVEALLESLPGEGRSAKTRFAVGDKVVVTRGDLTGMAGRVEEIREDGRVLVRATSVAINDLVDFDPDELRKTFEVGDHVRVLTGPHRGEAGMTLRSADGIVYIMSDTTKGELKVLARDLTESKDVASTEVEMLGQYMLHDLVQLDANTVGVIVLVDSGAAKVLTTNGTPERPEVRVCSENDIKSKIRNRTSTTDGFGNQVTFGDSVTVVEGPYKGKAAVVEYVWRGYLFLKSREFQDNGGFVCLRARISRKRGGITPTAANSSNSRGNDHMPYAPMSPLHASVPQSSNVHQSPRSDGYSNGSRGGYGGGRGGGGGGGRDGGFSGRSQHAHSRSTLVGQLVKVMRGSYMGYQGRVKHESATHVQLELDAINRVVTVGKDQLGGGPGQQNDRGGSSGRGSQRYGSTPNPYAPKTPLHAPMTPAWGAPKTPMHPGSKTPLHPTMGTPSAVPRTPMHPGHGTPHHMTPRHEAEETAWSVSGHDDTSGYPSASTPGGGYPSAATPGGAYPSAPTPGGAYPTAPTPGGYPSAPTPGGAYPSAPTPGGAYPSAPTPGGAYPSAPTPGGYPSAPTPGYMSALTPGGGYASAPTPGAYGSGYPFTPAADTPAAPTPGGEHMDAGTPGHAATPGMPYGSGITPDIAGTPGGGYDAYTPAGTATPGAAPTPGMGNAFTPAYTPGATPGDQGVGGYDGVMPMDDTGPADLEGVLVELPDKRQAVVRACNPDGSVRVQPLAADDPSTSVGPEEVVAQAGLLSVVPPGRKDRIKVLRGEFRGNTGTLTTMDGADGIVKLNVGVNIIEMQNLGRLV